MSESSDLREAFVAQVPALLRYALTLTRDADAAEDLVQDTLLRALERADTFRGDSSPATWLHRIMYHRFVDDRRRARESPVDEETLVRAAEERWRDDAYTVDAEAVLARVEATDELRDALVRLPVGYRSAVVLHDVEGYTAAQVGTVLGVSTSAAKQRIRRGRMMLVSALAAGAERRAALAGVPLRCWDARALVSDYLDGDLLDRQRDVVERHLRHCPTCPPLLASAVGVHAALGGIRDPDSVVPVAVVERLRVVVLGGHAPS